MMKLSIGWFTIATSLIVLQAVSSTYPLPIVGHGRAYNGSPLNRSCGLPSVLDSSVQTNREGMVGTWYQYMKKDASSATRNKILQNTVIGRTYYPGTNLPAVMLDQKIIMQ